MNRNPLAALLVILAVASSAPADEQNDSKAIQGTWLTVTAELAGTELPAEVRKAIKLVIDGEKYTVTVGKQVDEGTTKLDSSKSPKTLTITGTGGPNESKTILAIYELKGDSLKVCYDLSGKTYPTDFATKPGTKLYLVTYARAKP